MACGLVLMAFTSTGMGQGRKASVDGASDPMRWSTTISRTETPPDIDGRLDDVAWETASKVTDFRQARPVENSDPSEETVVYLTYDSDFLYVGVRCDQRNTPIIAKQMRRDGSLTSGDSFGFAIDTFFDRRNGYAFETNPVGARRDSLVVENESLLSEWDGIWYAKSSIDAEGWSAEFAIPFKTINFDPETTIWGINFERFIRGNRGERIRWASPRRNVQIPNAALWGTVDGLSGLDQGEGIDFKPFLTTRYSEVEDETAMGRSDGIEIEPGFDLFFKITPSLTAAFTVNTDFAETDVDSRQVNLTRFPTFFPEKRDFFLQDAGIFEFGGINRSPLPFFSRRVGIGPTGEEIGIEFGAKITGRVDDWTVGLLNVQLEDFDGLDAKNLAIGRVQYQVAPESTVGAMFTHGDPKTNGDNTLVGFDVNLRDSSFNGTDQIMEAHAFFMGTDTSGETGSGTAFGGSIGSPNDKVFWNVFVGQVGEDFNPALGFVSRTGIREYSATYRYRWVVNNDHIERFDLQGRFYLVTNLDDQVETRNITVPIFEIETKDGDEFRTSMSVQREQLFEPFRIARDVTIPADDYEFTRYAARFQTSNERPVRAEIEFVVGDFFNGNRTEANFELDVRPSENLSAEFELQHNDVHLDQGTFITRLISARVNLAFTPDLFWSTTLQYDNVSETAGVNSRVRWTVEPGSDIYVVVNQGFDTDGYDWTATSSDITTKIGWTFRF